MEYDEHNGLQFFTVDIASPIHNSFEPEHHHNSLSNLNHQRIWCRFLYYIEFLNTTGPQISHTAGKTPDPQNHVHVELTYPSVSKGVEEDLEKHRVMPICHDAVESAGVRLQ